MSEPINHYHKCSCGYEWGHELESPDYHAAHCCRRCGKEEVMTVSRWENPDEYARWQERAMRVKMNNFLFDLLSGRMPAARR